MTIALRGSAQQPTGSQQNPTTGFYIDLATGIVAGDLLFLTLTSRDSTSAGTLSVTDNDTGGNAWALVGNSTDYKLTVWWKRATSGTAQKRVTVANAVGSSAGVIKVFSGASPDATPYANVAVETNASGDTTQAGFTPTQSNSMVCCAICNYANDNAVTNLAFATLGATTMTECLSTGGNDCGVAFGHKVQSAGPAATGNLTWTNGAAAATYSIVWTIRAPTHATTGVLATATTVAAVAGTAAHKVAHPTSGVLARADNSAVTGLATRPHLSSGILARADNSAVAGDASCVVPVAYVSSAQIELPSSTITHPTEGVLAGVDAAVAGDAVRTALQRAYVASVQVEVPVPEHPTTGVLAGVDAVVVGAARWNTAHDADGALQASGAVVVGDSARSAPGFVTHPTEGVLAADAAAALVGAGARTHVHDAVGEVAVDVPAMTGASARTHVHTSEGAPAGAAVAVVGASARTHVHATEGIVAANAPAVDGVSHLYPLHTSEGALAVAAAAVDGASARTHAHASAGAISGAGVSVVGAARWNTAHGSDGVLQAPGSALIGDADRAESNERPTSGALVAAVASAVVGEAARTHVHAAEGIVAGEGSSVDGDARLYPLHAADGTLAGAGSAIDGETARTHVHDVAGTIAATAAAVEGDTARTHVHAATGAPAGAAADVVGSVARTHVHTNNGVLSGAGAVLSGDAETSATACAYVASVQIELPEKAGTHHAAGIVAGAGAAVDGASTILHTYVGSVLEEGALNDTATAQLPSTEHDAIGALLAQGSIIVGATRRNSVHGVTDPFYIAEALPHRYVASNATDSFVVEALPRKYTALAARRGFVAQAKGRRFVARNENVREFH